MFVLSGKEIDKYVSFFEMNVLLWQTQSLLL